MRDKITEILNLIKVKKFKEAQIKCDDVKKHLDGNVEFFHIYGFAKCKSCLFKYIANTRFGWRAYIYSSLRGNNK